MKSQEGHCKQTLNLVRKKRVVLITTSVTIAVSVNDKKVILTDTLANVKANGRVPHAKQREQGQIVTLTIPFWKLSVETTQRVMTPRMRVS